MKNIILVILIFAGFSYASAQEVYTSSGKPGYHKKTKKKKGYDPDKLIIGGGFVGGFASGYVDVGVSPILGYRFTDRFSAGVGIGYEYSQAPDINFSTYSSTYYDRENLLYPNIWSRFFVWRNLYVTGTFEYDIISLTQPATDYNTGYIVNQKLNVNVPCMLMGVGIRQPLGGRVSVFVEAMYDVLQQNYSPYYGQFPIVRFGVATGF